MFQPIPGFICCAGLSPPFLHTASDQNLEVELAWETRLGTFSISAMHCGKLKTDHPALTVIMKICPFKAFKAMIVI